jgi:hypothetical protein
MLDADCVVHRSSTARRSRGESRTQREARPGSSARVVCAAPRRDRRPEAAEAGIQTSRTVLRRQSEGRSRADVDCQKIPDVGPLDRRTSAREARPSNIDRRCFCGVFGLDSRRSLPSRGRLRTVPEVGESSPAVNPLTAPRWRRGTGPRPQHASTLRDRSVSDDSRKSLAAASKVPMITACARMTNLC